MGLRDTYSAAIQAAKGHMQGSADERDGKLYFHGTVPTEADANRIWDALKTVPSWRTDVVADIKVLNQNPAPASSASSTPQAGGQTYTVKAGDTLSKIAKELLGSANAYPTIFEANRDQLSDPDKIKPGQVLKIPAHG